MESELDYKDFNKIGRKSPYTAYHDQTTEDQKKRRKQQAWLIFSFWSFAGAMQLRS